MNRIVLALIFALGLQNLMAQPIAPPKKTLDEKYLEALGLMMSGKVPQATKDFEALLVEYPNQADVCYQLARLYDQAHDNNKALTMAKKSIANDPENRWYRIFLADILETNGKYAEAAAEYKTLIGKEDFKVELYTSYAYYLVKAGEDEKALKVYNEIEAKIGLTEEVSYNKHRLYAEMGKTAQATAEIKKLTAAWPNDIEIQRALAQWLVSIKDMPGATVAYEKVRMLDSDDAEAAAFLFEHSAATSSGSSNPLDKILNYLQGNDANLNAVLPQIGAQINSYLEKPTPELANKLLQVSALSVEKFGSEAAAFALHGDVLFHTGKYEQAYAAYAQSLKLDPKTRSVWEQMLYTNLVLRNWSALAADGERAIDRFPNSSVVCYLAGLGQLQGGDKVLAEEYLDMALVLSGKDIALQSAAIASLGRVKYLKNDFDGAIANFEQSVKLGSTPPETYDYWGDALIKQNKANEAVEKWKLAVEKGIKNPEIKRKIEQRSL